jgi:hypothetical protein
VVGFITRYLLFYIIFTISLYNFSRRNTKRHAPAAFPAGKSRYPLHRRQFGPQGRSERVRKISTKSGFDPRTVQPVASRRADWANPVHYINK